MYNISDRDGQTPAHVAVYHGELGCLKILQDKGKQVWHTKSGTGTAVYANYFYGTSVIFSNFIITYREPFTDQQTDVNWHRLRQRYVHIAA